MILINQKQRRDGLSCFSAGLDIDMDCTKACPVDVLSLSLRLSLFVAIDRVLKIIYLSASFSGHSPPTPLLPPRSQSHLFFLGCSFWPFYLRFCCFCFSFVQRCWASLGLWPTLASPTMASISPMALAISSTMSASVSPSSASCSPEPTTLGYVAADSRMKAFARNWPAQINRPAQILQSSSLAWNRLSPRTQQWSWPDFSNFYKFGVLTCL